MNASQLFTAIFDSIDTLVAYQDSWANGTGYMNGAVRAELGLNPGDMAKGTCPGDDKRRYVLVGTHFGNVIVFDRYTPGTGSAEVFVSNVPPEVKNILSGVATIGTSLDDDGISSLLGQEGRCENIGKRIARIIVRGAAIEKSKTAADKLPEHTDSTKKTIAAVRGSLSYKDDHSNDVVVCKRVIVYTLFDHNGEVVEQEVCPAPHADYFCLNPLYLEKTDVRLSRASCGPVINAFGKDIQVLLASINARPMQAFGNKYVQLELVNL